MNQAPLWTGPLCAFLSSITWAIGSSEYSKISRTHPAFAINFTRALVALPFFVLIVFLLGWNQSGSLGAGLDAYGLLKLENVGWLAISVMASYGVGDLCFLWSTRALGVPGALAIASIFPVWTTLAGVLFEGHPVLPLEVLGLLITLGGVITVILNEPKPAGATSKKPEPLPNPKFGTKRIAVLLALTTSILWAINSYAVARGGAQVGAAVGNTVRMGFALGINLILSRIVMRNFSVLLPWKELKHSVWIFIVEPVFGSFFFMYGLSNSPMAIGSTLTSLAPVLAVPVAWALRLEKVSYLRTLGVILVVTGLWLMMSAHP